MNSRLLRPESGWRQAVLMGSSLAISLPDGSAEPGTSLLACGRSFLYPRQSRLVTDPIILKKDSQVFNLSIKHRLRNYSVLDLVKQDNGVELY